MNRSDILRENDGLWIMEEINRNEKWFHLVCPEKAGWSDSSQWEMTAKIYDILILKTLILKTTAFLWSASGSPACV